jgi:hypothetical protein
MQFDVVYSDVNTPGKVDSEWVAKNADNMTPHDCINLIKAMMKATKMKMEDFLRSNPSSEKRISAIKQYKEYMAKLEKELNTMELLNHVLVCIS